MSCLSRKWSLVAAAWLCYLLAEGCTYSAGILYTEFLTAFQKPRAETAALSGLMIGIPLLMGPIVCPLVDTLGSARATAAGSLLLWFSFFVSCFANELGVLYFTLGCLASIGLELLYVAGIMAVSLHFTTRRGLATGITVSGAGVGVFVFNPLLAHLVGLYVWRGAMLVEAALFLNGLVAAALFLAYERRKPVSKKLDAVVTWTPGKRKTDESERPTSQEVTNPCAPLNPSTNENAASDNALEITGRAPQISVTDSDLGEVELRFLHREFSSEGDLLASPTSDPPYRSEDHLGAHKPSLATVARGGVRASKIVTSTRASECNPYLSSTRQGGSLQRMLPPDYSAQKGASLPLDSASGRLVKRVSGWADTGRPCSSTQEAGEGSSPDDRSMEVPSRSPLKKFTPTLEALPPVTEKKSLCSQFIPRLRTSLAGLVSPKIWTCVPFLAFIAVNFVIGGALSIPWTFMYHRALLAGIPEISAAFLISLIGIFSTVGQVVFGFSADYVHPLLLFVVSTFFAGLLQLLMSSIESYVVMSVVSALWGFCYGANYALYTMVLIRQLGEDLLYAALGIYLALIGVCNLVVTPLTGYISDRTGVYDLAFQLSGTLTMVCSLALCPLLIRDVLKYCRQRHTSIEDRLVETT